MGKGVLKARSEPTLTTAVLNCADIHVDGDERCVLTRLGWGDLDADRWTRALAVHRNQRE